MATVHVQGYMQVSSIYDVCCPRTVTTEGPSRFLRSVTSSVASVKAPRERLPVIEYKVSSFCSGGSCVEVGRSSADTAVTVRDAKDPFRSVSLTFSELQWVSFLDGIRSGDFDRS